MSIESVVVLHRSSRILQADVLLHSIFTSTIELESSQ